MRRRNPGQVAEEARVFQPEGHLVVVAEEKTAAERGLLPQAGVVAVRDVGEHIHVTGAGETVGDDVPAAWVEVENAVHDCRVQLDVRG